MPGAKRNFYVHPLFLVVGVLSALTGTGVFVFLGATLAALEHELAHALAARRFGYALDKVVLMPYGAVISGDLAGMPPREMLWVLATGPLINAATALGFVALWWLFPETYPYTDTAFYVSLSLFLVNLLPAYPLDGGRALRLIISTLSKKAADITGIVCNILTVCAVLSYFVYTCVRGKPAFTALAFSVLLLAGALGRGGGNYRSVAFTREKSFWRGVEERRVVISCDRPLRSALGYLREDRYLVLVLYEGDAFYAEMTEEEYLSALAQGDYSRPFRDFAAA